MHALGSPRPCCASSRTAAPACSPRCLSPRPASLCCSTHPTTAAAAASTAQLSDIPKTITKVPTALSALSGGATQLAHELFTNDVLYAETALDMSGLPPALLPLVPLFCRSLTQVRAPAGCPLHTPAFALVICVLLLPLRLACMAALACMPLCRQPCCKPCSTRPGMLLCNASLSLRLPRADGHRQGVVH